MALETNMANTTEPTHVVGQKCQKLAMACTVHSALAGHPSVNQLPIEKLCPCDLTDLYHVKSQNDAAIWANCQLGWGLGVLWCCAGRGERSEERGG
jgi:hypothetical protein